MREAVGSDNGVGSAGITEHASKQRAGAEQRNSTQNRLTGEKKELPSRFYTLQQCLKHCQGFFGVMSENPSQ